MNVDYNQYNSWQKVTAPNGAVYYKVPETGYLYDPFLSASKGRPVLFTDPSPQVDEQNRQRRATERAQSPTGQLLPVAGGVAGTVGAAYAVNQITNAPKPVAVEPVKATVPTEAVPPTTSQQAFSQGASGGAPAGYTFDPSIKTPKVIGAGDVVPEGYQAVGAAEGGGQVVAPNEAVKADGSVDLGAVGQGALGAFQLYQGYREYKQGNYLGAGINAAAGSAAIGAAAYGADSAAAGASEVLGPVAGAYGAYQTVKGAGDMPSGGQRNSSSALSGAASGAAIGSAFGPIGTGIGAVAGAAIGLGLSLTGSSKDKYQMIRDKVRDAEVKQGALRQDETGHQFGKLADGSEFDFSKDGKKYGKPQFDNPLFGQAAAFGDVIASAQGLSGRAREAAATMYSNAAISNAKDENTVLQNYQNFAQQRGLSLDSVLAQIDKLKADEKNKITDSQYNVWRANAQKLFQGAPSAPAGQPAAPTTSAPPPPMNVSPAVTKPLVRSTTQSPGIDLQGNLINYQRLGLNLASRINNKNQGG